MCGVCDGNPEINGVFIPGTEEEELEEYSLEQQPESENPDNLGEEEEDN